METTYEYGIDSFVDQSGDGFLNNAEVSTKKVIYGTKAVKERPAEGDKPARPAHDVLTLKVTYLTAKNQKEVTVDFFFGIDASKVTISADGYSFTPQDQKTFRLPKGSDGFLWIQRFIDSGAIPKSAFKGNTKVFEGYSFKLESLKNPPNSKSEFKNPYPFILLQGSQPAGNTKPVSTPPTFPAPTPSVSLDPVVAQSATEALKSVMTTKGKTNRGALAVDIQGYATTAGWKPELRSAVSLALYDPQNLAFLAAGAGYKLVGEEITT